MAYESTAIQQDPYSFTSTLQTSSIPSAVMIGHDTSVVAGAVASVDNSGSNAGISQGAIIAISIIYGLLPIGLLLALTTLLARWVGEQSRPRKKRSGDANIAEGLVSVPLNPL